MTVINTNLSALIANNAISQNDRAMSASIEKLATGSRITSAKDDAAGLSISVRMNAQIGGLDMATRNVNDAISLLQTADGAASKIGDLLGRMRELAVQASSDTYTTNDRAALDQEYQALLLEIDRIAETTEWNGEKILAGADPSITNNLSDSRELTVQVGAKSSQTMGITIKPWLTSVAVTKNDLINGDFGLTPQAPEQAVVTFQDVTLANGQTNELQIESMKATILNNTGSTQTITGAIFAGIWAEITGLTGNSSVLTDALGDNMGIGWSGFGFGGSLGGWVSGAVHDTNKVTFSYSAPVLNPSDLSITEGGDVSDSVSTVVTTTGSKLNQSVYGSDGLAGFVSPTVPNSITSYFNAKRQHGKIETAIDGALAERAKYGAYLNRLQHAADNLTNISTNTSTSLSRIIDTDYAEETTELARSQIITQASTAMLAQANQSKQTVLALLR
jgi:flagellin